MSATTARSAFTRVFPRPLPVLGMLHLKGDGAGDVLDRARREAVLLAECGVDGLVVEDYYGTVDDVESVLTWLASAQLPTPYGVNVLDDGLASFRLADAYGASFVQMDSISGHLAPTDDEEFAAQIAEARAASSAVLLGGVRFKYQPVKSGNPLDVDLRTAMGRCDAVVVTGDGTGMETSPEKIKQFREIVGPGFPLVVGAGVTAEAVGAAFSHADAAIIGSSLKDTGAADGEISGPRVLALMEVVARLRTQAPGDPT